MKPTRFFFSVLLSAVIAFSGITAFAQETMRNADVVALVKAGLSSSIIIDKIRTSKTDFDLSTDALILLKQAGVSDEVVGAMLAAKTQVTAPTGGGAAAVGGGASSSPDPSNPLSPRPYGIYMYEDTADGKRMTQMMPAVSQQNRTGGGFTASITPFGLGKVKTKANLPGTAAKTQIQNTRPVFYFYLDNQSGGLNTASGIPATPNEFALIRFNVRSDNREVTIAKANAYGAKGGLSDEYVVEFTAEDMGNGIYKVTPTKDLKNGEYAFYLLNSGNSNASAAVGAKFFDFGVKVKP